ncbi:MAG: radical SAM protein [Calditrichia bacterium]
MRFETIFVEEQVRYNPYSQKILQAFPNVPVRYIRKVEDVFGRVKKPYLHKRTGLNIFVGRKEGHLVKEAPDAYGLANEPHYYFIHAYNCIYECEYCYLQGYFNSPDLVFFVNHDEIVSEMHQTCAEHPEAKRIWFHAGEFSDSLALSHVTAEWDVYWEFLRSQPRAKIELRTKSVNIKALLDLPALDNVTISFSLSPDDATRKYDRKTPSFSARLKALHRIAKHGYRIGIHFDPIVDSPNLAAEYQDLLSNLLITVKPDQIEYISLGVVRFTKDVYSQFKRNYPNSDMQAAEFVSSFDNKVRYSRPHRLSLLNRIKQMCIEAGLHDEQVYLCMENETLS